MVPKEDESVEIIAAPVGVTISVVASDGFTGIFFKMPKVAGTGTGICPWEQSTEPDPRGTTEANTFLIPRYSTHRKEPIISTIESIPPISWKWIVSISLL